MKALFLASVAVVGLFGGSAFASDLPTKAPVKTTPIAAPPYNWSGFYLGANFGGAWSSGSLNLPGNNFYGGITEFIGGVQGGYNYQAGHVLVGVEGEFDGTAFNHPALPAPMLGLVSQSWVSTVAGRVGLVNDRWLAFAKLGGGWVHSNAAVNLPGAAWNGSSTNGGWLLGGGIEYGFKPHWTLKLEYDYLARPNWTSPTIPAVSLNHDLQLVKAGINYKFESGVAAEAAPSGAGGSAGSAPDAEELRKQAQNPISTVVTVPFQSTTSFNSGPFNRTQEGFNIQPLVPLHLNADWNVISRTIIPLMSQPDPLLDASTNGIGDITQSLFLTPVHAGKLIWGVGPVFTVPSANDPILGTGKFLLGATAVILTSEGHWTMGALLNNQWSVGGNPLRPPVNTGLAQPFLNYNMAQGWYLTTSPIITVNWLAPSGQQWTVPIGGGFGRVFKVGDQPINAQVQGFYNAIRPTGTADWQFRALVAFMFPEK